MGQMMFTKYIVVVDDDIDVHNAVKSLCANTDGCRGEAKVEKLFGFR